MENAKSEKVKTEARSTVTLLVFLNDMTKLTKVNRLRGL